MSSSVARLLDDRFHDSGPLQSLDLSPQNAGIPTPPYDSNFGNAQLVASGLGDAILLTPCLREWKRRNPRGKLIAYCASEQVRDVLRHNPHINSTRRMRLWQFVMLFGRTPLQQWYGARFISLNYAGLLPSASYRVNASHILAEMLELTLDDPTPELFLTRKEILAASGRLRPYPQPIAIHVVGSCTPNKLWPLENWTSVIRELSRYTFVQLGTQQEPLIPGAVDMRGLRLRDSFATLGTCATFVGVDSVLAHAAVALKVPALVLFGPTTPIIWGHATAASLYGNLRCSPCVDILRDGTCPYRVACMQAITPESVCEAILDRMRCTPQRPNATVAA